MARKITFAVGEYFHIYNRGVEKRNIFPYPKSYKRFLALLYLCNNTEIVDLKIQGKTLHEIDVTKRHTNLVAISAYCLMPNHFHLLVKEIIENGISKFMQKLTTAYTMYFNKRQKRTGSLFESTFKAEHIDNDIYLKYLLSYIHLNPVKILDSKWKENGIQDRDAAKKFLENYAYSSFHDYSGKDRLEKMILSKMSLPQYFETLTDFESSVLEWLNYSVELNKV